MPASESGVTRIDAAHRPPTTSAAHQTTPLTQRADAPTPFTWQDLNLSSEKVAVEVRLGSRRVSMRELESLKSGRVVRLDTSLNEPVEIRMDDEVIGYGQMVIVQGQLGIEITELRQAPRRRTA